MPSYFLHSSQLWLIANQARQRAIDAAKESPDAPAVDAVVAIIFSAAAAEGFINELASCLIDGADAAFIPADLTQFAQTIQSLESTHKSTLIKYSQGWHTLAKRPIDETQNPYRDLELLFGLRDMIIHPKARNQAGPPKGRPGGRRATHKMPDLVVKFQKMGLATRSHKDVGMSWFSALQTDKMADWACKASFHMIVAILNLIPDLHGGIADHFRRQFDTYKRLLQ